MRIEVGKYSKSAFESLSISYPGERELVFSAGGYRSTKLIQRDPTEQEFNDVLFNEVNHFVQDFLKPEQRKALYECYQRVETVFNNNTADDLEYQGLEEGLQELVAAIYEIVTFDDLVFYVKTNRNLKIPPELSDEYKTSDKITQAYIDKTYTRSEYIDLMALVLGLRFMIPIWGDYMNLMSTTHGVNMKEYFSFMLLNKSDIRQSRAFTRMEIYVRANITAADQTMASTLNFLSTDEIPLYAIAATSLRKLSIAPLSYEMDNHHLMKILYSYATSKIKGIGNLEKGLQPKTGRSGGFVDDNSSVFCSFKMKEQISAGELVYIQTYIGRYKEAAERIAEGIDPAIVELCVQNVLNIPKWKILDVQKGLVAWVLSPVVPANIIPMLNRQTLLTAMGISQAVMWHWKLYELAIMVTGRPRPQDPDEFRRIPEGRALPDSAIARLNEIYPYELPVIRGDSVRWSANAGVRGISLIHEQLSKEDWVVQCPKELAALWQDAAKIRFIEPSSTLRESLAELLFNLNDLKF